VNDSPQRRIIDAARRRLARDAPGEVSLSDIAAEAGVSKALIHYHFRDRDALIAAVVDDIGDALAERERGALEVERSALAVDALWTWLDAELTLGEIRAALLLTDHPSEAIRAAARRVATSRRNSATETVARLFELLGLQPRIPAGLLADVTVAFVDGLALDAREESRPARVAFDVFWLAMLNLAE